MVRDHPQPAIRTEGLSKRYGTTLALDRLDLEARAGEVYGYLGPNGSGKTTTIRLLLGLHRPSGGRAELFGLDAWSDSVRAHRRVAHVAGEPFLWPALTGAETLAPRRRRASFRLDRQETVAPNDHSVRPRPSLLWTTDCGLAERERLAAGPLVPSGPADQREGVPARSQ